MREEDKSRLVAYTDGACWPNPGPGAWAFVVLEHDGVDWRMAEEGVGRSAETTNNRMEMMAVIEALELHGPRLGAIYSDSMLVVKTANEWRHSWRRKEWIKSDGAVVKNLDLVKRLDALLRSHPVPLKWVKGHNGDVWNERADVLAQQAAQGLEEFESGAEQSGVTGGGPTSGHAAAESGHPTPSTRGDASSLSESGYA